MQGMWQMWASKDCIEKLILVRHERMKRMDGHEVQQGRSEVPSWEHITGKESHGATSWNGWNGSQAQNKAWTYLRYTWEVPFEALLQRGCSIVTLPMGGNARFHPCSGVSAQKLLPETEPLERRGIVQVWRFSVCQTGLLLWLLVSKMYSSDVKVFFH